MVHLSSNHSIPTFFDKSEYLRIDEMDEISGFPSTVLCPVITSGKSNESTLPAQ
jgi:hypothetical protein